MMCHLQSCFTMQGIPPNQFGVALLGVMVVEFDFLKEYPV